MKCATIIGGFLIMAIGVVAAIKWLLFTPSSEQWMLWSGPTTIFVGVFSLVIGAFTLYIAECD